MAAHSRRFMLTSAVTLLATAACPLAAAQTQAAPVFDAAARAELMKAVVDAMRSDYIFPELVPQVQVALADLERTSAAAAPTSPAAFADAVTQTLQIVARDKHLRVRHHEQPQPERSNNRQPTPDERAAFERGARAANFGIERVERLPGNIGYLELRGFMPVGLASGAITAAMQLLAHTEVLVVDLRCNGGGDPRTVQLVCSYLLDPGVHLNDQVWRNGRRDEFRTLETLPGPRYGTHKPVYVLTSARTFSGAEEFSYNLRHLKRATLVGETTGGGANPGGVHRLNAHFSMFVPSGRAVNPITGTNWEGTGVEPHLKVAADDALRVAKLQALKALLSTAGTADERARLQSRVDELERAGSTVR